MHDRWQKGIDMLKDLRAKQSPLYAELFNKLRPEFDEARDMSLIRPKDGGFMDAHKAMLEDINRQWDADFGLENSFYLTERHEQGYKPAEYDPDEPDVVLPKLKMPWEEEPTEKQN